MLQRRKFLKSTTAALGAACCASSRAGEPEAEEPMDLGDLVAKYFHQAGRS